MPDRTHIDKNDNVGRSFYSPASPLSHREAETAYQPSTDRGTGPPSPLAGVMQANLPRPNLPLRGYRTISTDRSL